MARPSKKRNVPMLALNIQYLGRLRTSLLIHNGEDPLAEQALQQVDALTTTLASLAKAQATADAEE